VAILGELIAEDVLLKPERVKGENKEADGSLDAAEFLVIRAPDHQCALSLQSENEKQFTKTKNQNQIKPTATTVPLGSRLRRSPPFSFEQSQLARERRPPG